MLKYENLEAYRLDHFLPDDNKGLIVGVSGGRSSAYQMAHIIEANGGPPPGVIFNFNNTGKEREETLAFVDRLDRHFQLGVTWIEYDPSLPTKVKRVTFETAARNGEPFDALLSEIIPKRRDGTSGVRPLPNVVKRSCTTTLKVKTIHRYVRRHLGWSTKYYGALGYRADEKSRYEKRMKLDARGWPEAGKAVCPMYHAGVDESRVRAFWSGHPELDLKLDSNFGNCDFCFMKSTWKIKESMMLEAMQHQINLRPGATPPFTVQWWIDKEERVSDRPGPFRRDRPSFRTLWEQICERNLESSVPENKADICGSCSD